MTGSLKSRMARSLAVWIAITWAVALAGMYACMGSGKIEDRDDQLKAAAVKLLELTPVDAARAQAGQVERLRAPVDVSDSDWMVFQLWRGRELVATTRGGPTTPLRPSFATGFDNVEVDGKPWRVYVLPDRTGTFQVQVGNARDQMDDAFQRRSLRVMVSATVPLILAGFLMWWSVQRSIEPLARIEAAARSRSRFDLTPLPAGDVPTELQPLIGGFNHLLTQLDQAIQAERRFIGDAAHELRTPLSALQAHVEVAIAAPTEQAKDAALQKVLTAVQRSARLAEQLLDLARTEAGSHAPRRERYDLAEIVRHVASEFEITAQRQQRAIELNALPCDIVCDVDEVGILVRNLVDNGLRYTGRGGTVRIRCGRVDGADELANGKVIGSEDGSVNEHVNEDAKDSMEAARETARMVAWLEVADDGPGVPAEAHGTIFERFQRLSGTHGVRGSGIGLSLVARIAAMHGARIETGDGFDAAGFSVRLLFPAR